MNRFSVLIAGGGVAALEAVLRLRRLAGDQIDLTVLAPNEEFVYRALTVGEPFSRGAPEPHPVGPLLHHADAAWVRDSMTSVDVEDQVVHTAGGSRLAFDALLIAVGARPKAVVPHARTFDDRHADEMLRGVVQDIEGGYVRRLAFVSPPGPVWPLPLYELALMSAHAARDAGIDDMQIDLFTAESRPLPAFGPTVGSAVAGLLQDAGIRFHASSEPEVAGTGRLVTPAGDELRVDSLVALPRLTGPPVKGIPLGDHGFIDVDEHCEVKGTGHRVYAAGDAIAFPVKHGGVGAQAADVAAAAIANRAGLDVPLVPFHPVVHGKLLTGAGPKFLFTRYVGGEGFDSVIADTPVGSTEKVTAAELTPYLQRNAA
ncbi:MAG TPA: FAD-dependent oxidoreductase [Thermoleophilaceae bacterium]|nr:FAD-dependent oxidoreductase [Thermoleophilaceae bacterium]